MYVKFVGNNAQDSQLWHFLTVDLSRSSNISYAMRDKSSSNLCATFSTSSSKRSLIVATNLVRKEEALYGVKENRNNLHRVKRRKVNMFGYLLRWNRHLEHVIGWNIVGRVDVRRRGGRKRKQLLDDLKETRGLWKLKEKALDRILWKTHIGRSNGPVVRQTA